ncbi:MAG: ABC transporter permease [Acidimicrobiales bacterium]
MTALRIVGRKVLYLIPVLFAVTLLTFLLIKLLPGDPAVNILGPSATPQAIADIHRHLGLDKPLPAQYLTWLGHALTGDLGRSYQNQQTTTAALKQRLPVTLELIVLSQLLALAVAIPVALIAATRAGGVFDRVSTTIAFGFLAVPDFILGVVLVYLFAVRNHWFPATGYTPFSQSPTENLKGMVLPVLTLALASQAVYLRLLRTDLIATLQQDYISMAKAKGLPSRYILMRHAFRPSSFSLVTVSGLQFGALIGGTFIVEVIFALPGVGSLAVQSIFSRDYLVVQGTVLLIAVAYVMINFIIDLLYTVIDPRIRHAGAI